MSMASKESLIVLVTGAIGKIGYYLVPKIARGDMLGADQPVILHLLDIPPAAEALNDVEMGLEDAAYTLLKGVVATTDVVEACTGVDIAVMIGGFPRKEGMERKDVMSDDISIYKTQVSALEKHAAANCKVLVVDNPASTIASILKEFALSIPEKNITFLTRVEHNMTLDLISKRLKVHVGDVKNAIIWGDHSSTLYPDVNHATVNTLSGDMLVREFITDDAWFQELITTVRQGGAGMITSRKSSSALYIARSACDHIHDWFIGTPEETWVSMGVYSDGSNGVLAGRFYSFPVTCRNGEWSIVQALRAPTSGISQSEAEANVRQILGLEDRFCMLHNKLNGLQNQLKGTGDELNGMEIRSKVEFAYYSFRIHELEGHASHAFDNISRIVGNLESKFATLESNLATTEVHLQQAIQEIAQWRSWYWNLIHVTPVLNSHSFNHQT